MEIARLQRPDSDDDLLASLAHAYFVPKKVNKSMTVSVLHDLPEQVKAVVRDLASKGWRFYFVDQRRGYCAYEAKVITLPVWAMKREWSYKTHYVAHECAHAVTGKEISSKRPHGPEFMENLKVISPKECIHWELEYKPRNAKSAGIGEITMKDL